MGRVLRKALLLTGVSPLGGTWDAAYKGSSVTLSGGSLVATVAAGTPADRGQVLGTVAVTGLKTWRVLASFAAEAGVGVAAHGVTLQGINALTGLSGYSIGYFYDGRIFRSIAGSVTTVATIAAYVTGDYVNVQYDQGGNQIRFAVNGGSWSAWYSTSSLVGPLYAAAAGEQTGSNVLTLDPT